jgi:hypothetical protein
MLLIHNDNPVCCVLLNRDPSQSKDAIGFGADMPRLLLLLNKTTPVRSLKLNTRLFNYKRMNEHYICLPASESKTLSLRIAVAFMIAMLGLIAVGSMAENTTRPAPAQTTSRASVHVLASNTIGVRP